jgi:DNA-binding NarL/FixJ family response regulator
VARSTEWAHADPNETPEIGAKLAISPKTVDTCKQRIENKLEIQHRSGFVQVAYRLGLLEQTEWSA